MDVLTILGTRPEAIKLALVLHALKAVPGFQSGLLTTGQQADLLPGFVQSMAMQADVALDLMRGDGDFLAFIEGAVAAITTLLAGIAPRAVLVQGDTASACAGALAAAALHIPVIHVEAGLRSGNLRNPMPEEALRILITHCASLHCAPTANNVRQLVAEGIDPRQIVQTGNPVVDAVQHFATPASPPASVQRVLDATAGCRRIVMTAHRRENFGPRLRAYFEVIRDFVERHDEVHVLFPVHPNPRVRVPAHEFLADHPRIHLLEPLGYEAFLHLLSIADLILSDSGGVQEETASLGAPLIVLREVTERAEIIATGLARLAPDAAALSAFLDTIGDGRPWPPRRQLPQNPFGDGHSGARIAACVVAFLER